MYGPTALGRGHVEGSCSKIISVHIKDMEREMHIFRSMLYNV